MRRPSCLRVSLVAAFLASFVALNPVGSSSHSSVLAQNDAPPSTQRVFEMRTYICHEGKLDALHQRFRDHTNRLFVKHGMQLIGYWTPVDGPGMKTTLVYILAYPSLAARDKSWADFKNDPDWKKAFADSHRDGPIVKEVKSQYLSPTDYSPIK